MNQQEKDALRFEIELVEQILELAKDDSRLEEANVLSMELLQKGDDKYFSAIDIGEYIGFRMDLIEGRGDSESLKEIAQIFLSEARADLASAKNKLQL